nr:response regulator [uncultured Holophaga sp.]
MADAHPGQDLPKARTPEREAFLLEKRLAQAKRAMRLLEEARDRYDKLYFHAMTHLSEALESNQELIAAAPIGVAVFSARSGTCVTANRALALLVGVEDERRILGMNLCHLKEWKAAGLLEKAEEALCTGWKQRMEARVQTGSGRFLWVDAVFVPLHLHGEKHLLVMLHDITERHEVEVTRRQSLKAEGLALMAGGIAHDFNNILQVILANLERIHSGRIQGEQVEDAFSRVWDSLAAAQALSGRLLSYSGKGFRHASSLDLGAFLDRNLPGLAKLVGREVRYSGCMGGPSLRMVGDPEQILQLITHLVVNAAEALDPGPGGVDLALSAWDGSLKGGAWILSAPEGPCLCLEVSDRGCGILAGQLDSICDPFFTTKGLGRGLGLSSVLGILKGHGGGLQVQSSPGEGSTFRALFPVGEMPEPAQGEPVGEPPGTKGTTVLVVDDDAGVRATCREILEECFGYAVLEAGDGVEAVEIHRRYGDSIQVVLMDASMPRMNGGEALDAIRVFCPEVRAILCSGFSESMSRDVFRKHGFVTYLQKPYRVKDLKQALDFVLGVPLEL